MPCDYKEYPDNWKWLSKQIIADAGDRCELCYAPNHEMIVRDKNSGYPWQLAENCGDGHYYPKLTKVILTVHHIDSDKKNNTKHNLIALCQRCHLRLDIGKHIRNRKQKKTKNANTLFADQCNSRCA